MSVKNHTTHTDRNGIIFFGYYSSSSLGDKLRYRYSRVLNYRNDPIYSLKTSENALLFSVIDQGTKLTAVIQCNRSIVLHPISETNYGIHVSWIIGMIQFIVR